MVSTTDLIINYFRDRKPYPLREYTNLIENYRTLKLEFFSPGPSDSTRALIVEG